MTMTSSSKIVSLDAALSVVQDGMTLGIGGWIFHGQPMALVRGLIRKGVRDLTLVPAPGSIAPDMLIGAGCVTTTACVFISFEHLGLAPNFRRAAQSGAIKVLEMDGPGIAGGLRAGACDLPYGLIPDLGTDLPRVNPEGYRRARVQDGGRPLLEVPAIKPDVVLLHGQQADEYGNVQYFGASYFDLLDGAGGEARDLPGRSHRAVEQRAAIGAADQNSLRLCRRHRRFAVRRASRRERWSLRTGRGVSRRLCRGEPRPGLVRCRSSSATSRERRGRLSRPHRRADAGAALVRRGIAVSATFEAIKRRRLSDDVSAQIQMRIASGELRSGDKLPPERELAERFGVSRGAVREALRTLERTGLVSLQAGSRGGAFIGQGNPGLIGDSFRNLYLLGSVSLDDLTEARQWLESTVVRMVRRARHA